jgi:hypothetical protein
MFLKVGNDQRALAGLDWIGIRSSANVGKHD